jgi:hypothetical protein
VHILVVRLRDGSTRYFGPFPTWFRANEYRDAVLSTVKDVAYCEATPLVLPHNMRVNFKGASA